MLRCAFILRAFVWLSLSCGGALTAYGQPVNLGGFDDLFGPKPRSGSVAKPEFTISVTPQTVAPGGEVTLSVGVKLPKGYYIYGTDGDFGGRTQIAVTTNGLTPLANDFTPDHPGKSGFDPIFEVNLTKFPDGVTWTRKYRVDSGTKPGEIAVQGTLSGQYCSTDDPSGGKCIPILPPHEFSVPLKVEGEAVATSSAPRYSYGVRPERGKINPLEFEFSLSPVDAQPGQKVTLAITAKLDPGWHTFSLTQDGNSGGGTPTEIQLDQLAGLKPLGEGFVANRPFHKEAITDDIVLEIHEGEVVWSREFEVLPDVSAGSYGVVGGIVYQTCKNSCLPPRTEDFTLGRLDAAKPVAVATTPVQPVPPKVAEQPAPEVVAKPQDRGLLPFLLTAIGFGFVSLLTPCVFPMVPITVSFFLKQAESQHHRPVTLAIVYCGAIVLAFTILGVGISAVFGAGQLNQLANNPWLNVAIGAVFVIFALNMLGMFEITVPGWLLTFTATKESTGGFVGAIFMALTFTLTSFTCTFAFAGTLLVAAAQGEYYWPIIGMLAFGAAFASPFFVLAMVPSLLKKLPKSGGWMNSVKVVMGLIEIGAAVKFFSVADLAFNPAAPVFFDYVIVLLMWLVVALAVGLYLLGVYRFPHDTPVDSITVSRGLLAMSFLGLTGLFGMALVNPNAGGGWLMNQIVAFAPPNLQGDVGGEEGPKVGFAQEAEGPKTVHHGVVFSLDIDKAIAASTKLNEPLFLDFTGVNCVNCRLMEKKMAAPSWKERLAKFVGAQLYVDVPGIPTITDEAYATSLWKKNLALQMGWFGDVSMPAYAITTPDGKTILATYAGAEKASGEFLQFMDEGLAKWEGMKQAALAKQDAALR